MTKHIKAVMSVCIQSTPEHVFLHSCMRTIHKPFVQTGTAKTCWRCCRYFLYQKGKEEVSTSSGPTPLLKQGHLNAVAQDSVVAFHSLLCPEFHHHLMVAAAMAAFDLHMPKKPLIVSMKSSTAPLLIDSSISQKWKLSSVYSRNLLNCLNSSVLCLQKIAGCLRPWKPGLVNVRLFLPICL